MRFKVEALDTYAKYNITDSVLKKIPLAGDVFEVDKERLDVLLGDNDDKRIYVKVLEEIASNSEEPIKEVNKKEEVAKKKPLR